MNPELQKKLKEIAQIQLGIAVLKRESWAVKQILGENIGVTVQNKTPGQRYEWDIQIGESIEEKKSITEKEEKYSKTKKEKE